MRKVLISLAVFLLALPMFPAEKAGNINGRVVDIEGNGLPGVQVTLKGSLTAPVAQITTTEGNFRFISLAPAKDYSIKAELQGFKTKTEERISINVGQNIKLIIVMEIGSLQENVTVIAQIPQLDLKKTSTTMNVDKETMESLPTARDTLSIMEFAPGVTPYKVYAGDSNTGLMNNAGSRGTVDNSFGVYSVDGQLVEGSYWDMDQWEEVQISIGGADVTRRTGNLTMNMVTKRGGNNFSFGGRFFVSDKKFQSNNLTEALKQEGVEGTDRLVLNKDYGFNLGGPIVINKAWFWMGYGVQDVHRLNVTNTPQNYVLTTYNAKLNFQIVPQNRLELYLMTNEKLGVGRDASPSDPVGVTQRDPFHFGRPTWRINDEHMFGDSVYLSISGLGGNAGLILEPGNNENAELIGVFNQGSGVWSRRADFYGESRPRYDFNFAISYFNENLFGLSHEIKAGYAWEKFGVSSFSRNNVVKNIDYLTDTVDITGDGFPDVVPDITLLNFQRWGLNNYGRYINGGYLSDTISKGPLTMILGVRYDYVTLYVNPTNILNSVLRDSAGWKTDFTPATADAVDAIIPGFTAPKVKPDYGWGFLSPRLGLTWDIGGKNRTLAKLTLSRYPSNGIMVNYWDVGDFLPLGADAWMNFWWLDDSGDGIIDYRELYWHNSTTYAPYRVFNDAGGFVGNWADAQNIMWGSFDPDHPKQLTTAAIVDDKSIRCESVREATVSLEHEFLPNLMASTTFTYCIFDKPNWILRYWPDTGKIESQEDYVQVGTIPAQVGPYSMGDGANRPYYLLRGDIPSTVYQIRMQRPDYARHYYEMTLAVNKKMSEHWMANASFTLCKDSMSFGENGYYYGDPDETEVYGINPTTRWAFEGRQSYSRMPRWMFKFQGLYKFPWDINLAMTLYGREGSVIDEYVTIVDYNAPNPEDQSCLAYVSKYGSSRLKPLYIASLRLEKAIKMSDKGTIYLMADVFSLFNPATIVSRFGRMLGTYYIHDGSFVPNPQSYAVDQTLAPRHVRFGIRFQF